VRNVAEHGHHPVDCPPGEGEGRPPPHLRIWSACSGGSCFLVVEDNGPGLPPEYAERAFKMFEVIASQTESRPSAGAGTGVGLAVVRRVAEAAFGRVWIEPSPLGGVRVVMEIPVQPIRLPHRRADDPNAIAIPPLPT